MNIRAAHLSPMKTILAGLLILTATTFLADGRAINGRRFRELDNISDLVVVARPVSTQDTAEQTNLPGMMDIQVVGLSSEFEVSFVLKGDNRLKRLVMHHYRLANPNQLAPNGPNLASFNPKEPTRYLLFLQREPDGRYAPFDQVDPPMTSMLKLSDTGWDQMKFEDFKNWLDARKWQDEFAFSPTIMSPEITPDGRGEGSLREAALNGNLEKARALIKANPGLVFSQPGDRGETPLHLAAEGGRKEMAELLLANKAEVNATNSGGWTPLFNAVFWGHQDLVELLLTNRAEVNIKDNAGWTPLHWAAQPGWNLPVKNSLTEIAAFLLAVKADVNAKNQDGSTPLHLAVAHGRKDLVELLLANQAEINAKDNEGRTPLDFAKIHDNTDLADWLRQHGAE